VFCFDSLSASNDLLIIISNFNALQAWKNAHLTLFLIYFKAAMSNMRPFASTPAARTRDTVIWSFNGQNCSFYNLNWINVRPSQINSMLFFIQNKNKNILQ